MKKLILFWILAVLLFSSCSQVYRSIRYFKPEIDEYNAFPQVKIEKSDKPFHFSYTDNSIDSVVHITIANTDTVDYTLDEYLQTTSTTAFLIIRNDTILFEKYYKGYQQSDISTLFSVSKSITSLLVGIAVDEGYMKSVNDKVTDYIPELLNSDPNFQKLSIEHLLNFQAGFKYNESYVNPFSGMARLYYGGNQLAYLKKLKFKNAPGEKTDYNSATTAFLGILLERAVHKTYAEYLQEKVWKPLGMQYDASISLDDKKHRSAKSYAGLNTTAIDLAKIGRLYLNSGNWNGNQIVSNSWIEKSKTPNIGSNHFNTKYKGYQNHWYNKHYFIYDSTGSYYFLDSISALKYAQTQELNYFRIFKENKTGKWIVDAYYPQFYALGILNQFLFVDPESNIVIVRLGKDWDRDALFGYEHLMYLLGKKLSLKGK